MSIPAELYQQFYKPLARQQPIEILGGRFIYLHIRRALAEGESP
jgi:hypothetical protein